MLDLTLVLTVLGVCGAVALVWVIPKLLLWIEKTSRQKRIKEGYKT